MLQARVKKLVEQGGVQLGPGGVNEASFQELVRRGLMEVDFRKLARLADDYSRRCFDPLFDPAAPDPITFGELADQFLEIGADEARANKTSQKSIDRQRARVALVRQIVGEHRLVQTVDYDACIEIRRTLARVPTNWTKYYSGLALHDAIRRGAAEERETLAPITQGQYLATLREMLDLAAKKRLIPINPAEGLQPLVRDTLSASQKRLPFEPSQLAAFFRSEFYVACANSGPFPYRHDKTGGWRFWLPLLSLFTGLRPRELLQLHIDDVRQTPSGVFYLDVVASEIDDERPTKRLKTASSKRRVPLHPVLIGTGFLAFVEDRRRAVDEDRLFPGLRENRDGDPAWYALKRFNEAYLPREIPHKRDRQVFYSFRHTFRDGLRAIGAGPDILQALGWSQGSRIVSKSGLPLGMMFTARFGGEGTLFRLAGQLEQERPWRAKRERDNPIKVTGASKRDDLNGTRSANFIRASGLCAAQTGRTHDCTRPDSAHQIILDPGDRPHMPLNLHPDTRRIIAK